MKVFRYFIKGLPLALCIVAAVALLVGAGYVVIKAIFHPWGRWGVVAVVALGAITWLGYDMDKLQRQLAEARKDAPPEQ